MINILVIGGTGQLGNQFKINASNYPEMQFTFADRSVIDLSNLIALNDFLNRYEASLISSVGPKIIINTAAYTNVEEAEDQFQLASIINYEAVALIANFTKKHNYIFVHYSTDYIFDGTKLEAYTEEDTPSPINNYGKSKLEGERAIKESLTEYIILRISWVFSKFGNNFVKKIAWLMQGREKLSIIHDQIGNPNSTNYIVNITLELIKYFTIKNNLSEIKEIINVSQQPSVSWFEFATSIKESLMKYKNIPLAELLPITSEEYLTKAKRPLNSRLDTKKLALLLPQHNVKSWKSDLNHIISKLYG